MKNLCKLKNACRDFLCFDMAAISIDTFYLTGILEEAGSKTVRNKKKVQGIYESVTTKTTSEFQPELCKKYRKKYAAKFRTKTEKTFVRARTL